MKETHHMLNSVCNADDTNRVPCPPSQGTREACVHELLERHEYHGQIWWQCDNGCDFIFRPAAVEGTWPADYMGRAFVEGAKWWEFEKDGATMWPSDRDKAAEAALTRYPFTQRPVDEAQPPKG